MGQQLDAQFCRNFHLASRREWVLPNRLGGYAMGTVSGANQRRYHGLLVAAEPAPAVRTVLLSEIECYAQGSATSIGLSTHQYVGALNPEGYQYLDSVRVNRDWVEWVYRAPGISLTRRAGIHAGENAVTIEYENSGSEPMGLTLRPLVCHKFYHENFRSTDEYPEVQAFPKNRTIVEHGGKSLILRHDGAQRMPTVGWYYRFESQRELERGLDSRDDLFCPCELHYELLPGQKATIVGSLGDEVAPRSEWIPEPKGELIGAQLAKAAEKFIVETPSRTSIIAGYPWFTDWGRDTMISIPGICIATGRLDMARKIILDYGAQMNQGIIPNRFADKGEQPEYNTVDATLWFAQAIYTTLQAEWDKAFATKALEFLKEAYTWHLKGTHYGIKVDEVDGLLTQGEHGIQLTWMDAKVGDWVVTPRHGKPVEINGLWINMLHILAWLSEKLGEDPTDYEVAAVKAEESFDRKFFKASLGYYLDTVDPDDGSIRPNQVIAMALPFGPAKGPNAVSALQVVTQHLLTPVGLRTLAPGDPNYHGRFEGSLPELDAAYHQGTVWPWLLGPYVSALVRVTGDKSEARRILKSAKDAISEYGIDGIAEVYDGDEPRRANGCPWQAWSVGEWLRVWNEVQA